MLHKNHIIIGLGATGLSVVRYLRGLNQPCIVLDSMLTPQALPQLKREFPEVKFQARDLSLQLLDDAVQLVVSPGVPLNLPIIVAAKARKIPVVGDIELLAHQVHEPIVAITGTNGKSTVTSLVGAMVKAAGKKAAVGGNLGEPALNFLIQDHYELWVLELSSFQLDTTISLKPRIATILNVTPDHLYRYSSLAQYAASKQRVYQGCEVAVYNREDPHTRPLIAKNIISFGLDEPSSGAWGIRNRGGNYYLAYGADNVLNVAELKIYGRHNWQNALAALAIGQELGLNQTVMLETLRDFTGLPHRCQWVREKTQIVWYNDSKATNVGATISAIQGLGGTMKGKIILIAGGQSEGAAFEKMHDPVKDYVRTLVLIGQDSDKLAVALEGVVPIVKTDTMDNAVKVAQKQAQPGDVVLLSPACKSFDMFKNYAHRGDEFIKSVQSL